MNSAFFYMLVIALPLIAVALIVFLIFKLNRLGEQRAGNNDPQAADALRWEQQLAILQQQHQAQLQAVEERFGRLQEAAEARRAEEMREISEMYRRRNEESQRTQQAVFEAAAARLLKLNTEDLSQTNKQQIEALLNPFQQNLSQLKQAVDRAYVDETAQRKSLTDQIERLMKVGMTIGEDARNLTSALKGNSKVQGDWGEMVLEELLQSCGLQRGIGYEVQVTRDANGQVLRDEEGHSMRPDVVVNMPDNQKIVIDSKVSLTAYVDYCNSLEQPARDACMQRHLKSVRSHIDELDSKGYLRIKNTADYVMMFIPNEAAYIAAVQAEPTLWKYAFDRHVVLVSPTHLYSVVSIIAQMWRQDAQNKNAMQIAERGGKLYDKLAGALQDFRKINDQIARLQEVYNTVDSRLYTGRGCVASQAEKLRELGVNAKKKLPGSETGD